MLIRISLLLVLASLTVFLLVELALLVGVSVMPTALTLLGMAMILSGFTGLIIACVFGLLKALVYVCLDYFSLKQRAQRRLLFVQFKQDQFKRQFYFRIKQMQYVNEFSKKRLLESNNRKHLKSLSRAINSELLTIKPKLSAIIFLQLQQDHLRYSKQKNIEALLILQQKISTFV